MGVGRDPGALPTTTKLSLRLDEVEAMPCNVHPSGSLAEMQGGAQDLIIRLHLGFILATHL